MRESCDYLKGEPSSFMFSRESVCDWQEWRCSKETPVPLSETMVSKKLECPQESWAERSKRPKPGAREKRFHVSQISHVRSPCERDWKPDHDGRVMGG